MNEISSFCRKNINMWLHAVRQNWPIVKLENSGEVQLQQLWHFDTLAAS